MCYSVFIPPKVNPSVIRGVHVQKPQASLTAIYGYTPWAIT